MWRSWSNYAFIECKFQLPNSFIGLKLEVSTSCFVPSAYWMVQTKSALRYTDCICGKLKTRSVLTGNGSFLIVTEWWIYLLYSYEISLRTMAFPEIHLRSKPLTHSTEHTVEYCCRMQTSSHTWLTLVIVNRNTSLCENILKLYSCWPCTHNLTAWITTKSQRINVH